MKGLGYRTPEILTYSDTKERRVSLCAIKGVVTTTFTIVPLRMATEMVLLLSINMPAERAERRAEVFSGMSLFKARN